MMSRFSSAEQVAVGEDRHLLRAGEHGLVDVLGADAAIRSGRSSPRGQRAAGAREVVAGRAVGQEDLAAADDRSCAARRSARDVVVRLGVGIAGPGPSEATYAASGRDLVGRVDDASCCGACAPGWAIGIRPVPTWKSTAAAPTPTSEGPSWLPSSVHDALAVLAVAGGAADEEQLRGPWPTWAALRRSCWAGGRREGGVQAAGQQQPEQQHHEPGERAAALPGESAERSGSGGARRVLAGVLVESRCGLLDEVDGGEQADPDDVDEVPVVRHDDGADGLLVGEPAGQERAARARTGRRSARRSRGGRGSRWSGRTSSRTPRPGS